MIRATARGYSGYELERVLRTEHRIQVEMSEPHQVTLLVMPGHTVEQGKKLVAALASVPRKESTTEWEEMRRLFHSVWSGRKDFEGVEIRMREAFFASSSAVNLEKAVDRTCAELLYCYPPGVPFVCPGQRFSRETLELIETARRLGWAIRGGSPDPDSVMTLDNEP